MSATLDPVDATLADYASLTREAVAAFLSARAPSPYLDVLIREYPSRGGKGIRPALLIATCRAFGGPVREALGVAVALELLHNAFLIHDDFEDSSERRRGQPTLHAMHGAALAINEGKRTLMLLHLLSAVGSRRRAWLVEFLGAPEAQRSGADVDQVLAWMERYGSLEFGRSYGDRLAAAAGTAFELAFADVPESEHVAFVRQLIPFMLTRSA